MRHFVLLVLPLLYMNRPDELRAKKWYLTPVMPAELQQSLGDVHPVLLQVLYNRGVSTPASVQAFLEGHYLKSTDPFLLADMEKAVARIQQALENDETVIVYGDFDADGVTSTVLLTEALRGLGFHRQQAQPYIPDRIDEGYGLNEEALIFLKEEKGADLVITVDCGIRAFEEVAKANEIGLDMIVTDHHSLGTRMPPATAVINPKRKDSDYPEKMLAGVGIAFKLAQALRQSMPERARYEDSDLLDLVAIGTVADLAPLLDENRKLVREGLAVLNQSRRPGITALREIAGLNGNMTAETIAFGIGPRINAAGRLSHAYTAARLLAVTNQPQAFQLARKLNGLNRQRQQLTAELGERAEMLVDPEEHILIAADTGFLPGIVGLVASRLADKNYRPAIVIEQGEEESRGSCRSIPEFHITEALDEVADLLVRHGGHKQAAGFTVRNGNLPRFVERMKAIAQRELGGKELLPTLTVDVELDLETIDWALHDSLAQLEPTGYANPSPVFMSRNVEVLSHRVVGRTGAHLQLRVANAERHGSYFNELPAIAFRQAAWAQCLPQRIDLAYTINVNEWRGRRNLQLIVQDIRPSER